MIGLKPIELEPITLPEHSENTRALGRMVAADPHNDSLRLVYADALAEDGDTYQEFMERMTVAKNDAIRQMIAELAVSLPLVGQLVGAVRELIALPESRWEAPAGATVRVPGAPGRA